jgi:UDP-N-acetyl-D-mannosaminuronate dehydrogenase
LKQNSKFKSEHILHASARYILVSTCLSQSFDPNFSKEELRQYGFASSEENDSNYDILIIQTYTPSFKDYITKNFTDIDIQLIYDGRNLFKGENPLDKCELMTLGMNFQDVESPQTTN